MSALGAGAGEETNQKEKFQVPLHSEKPEEGSITYLFPKSDMDTVGGIFSFTFYIVNEYSYFIYILGIYIYSQIIKETLNSEVNPFSDWKILIYTDQFTYNILESYRKDNFYIEYLLTDPNVRFAVVNWPSQQTIQKDSAINGPALRPFRSRAPFDFPTKLIFIRDADTLFPSHLKSLEWNGEWGLPKERNPINLEKEQFNRLNDVIKGIGKWEREFYNEIPGIQTFLGKPPLIIGAGYIYGDNIRGRLYFRAWHTNQLLDKTAPFGVFAGFVNVSPGIPLYQSVKPWDEFVDFQNQRSFRMKTASEFQLQYGVYTPEQIEAKTKKLLKNYENEMKNQGETKEEINFRIKQSRRSYNEQKKTMLKNVFSNIWLDGRIGRDEQLYLFLFLPKVLEYVYFYKIDYTTSLSESNGSHKANQNFHNLRKKNFEEAVQRNFQEKKIGGNRKRTKKRASSKFEKRKTHRLK